jgi:hypothetical protein
MSTDQRYCLECGERRNAMSSVLAGGPAGGPAGAPPRAQGDPSQNPPPRQPPPGGSDSSQQRANTLTVIAGVGVLMLAMGVGVLIGRAGGSKPSQAPPPGDQRRVRPDRREHPGDRGIVHERLAGR